MPPSTASDLHLAAHEERLQRVESNSEETRIKVAEIATKLDYQLSGIERAEKATEDLGAKIDTGFEKLNLNQVAHQQAIMQKIESHAKLIDDHGESLAKIQAKESARTKASQARKGTAKKLAIGLLLASMGVFGAKLAEVVLEALK